MRYIVLVAALVSCTQRASAPGDAPPSCEADCAHRKAIGCLESDRCVDVCVRARAAGLYEPCTSCVPIGGGHIRCNP